MCLGIQGSNPVTMVMATKALCSYQVTCIQGMLSNAMVSSLVDMEIPHIAHGLLRMLPGSGEC